MAKSLGLVMGVILFTAAVSAQTSPQYYSQCGGIGWAGSTTCPSGWSCNYFNDWYSQCIPGIVSTAPPTAETNPGGIVTPILGSVATLAPGHSFVHTAVGSMPTA